MKRDTRDVLLWQDKKRKNTEEEQAILDMYAEMRKKSRFEGSSGSEEEEEEDVELEPFDGEDQEQLEDEEEGGDDRRGITYQIAKNKGLTAKRKKEYRNPRVRHKMKYRKAKISRKGQRGYGLMSSFFTDSEL
ncbi:hypothetical protein HPB52_010116 [Rhipicephalus sanguineus]|uniref:Sas10 C-terminal domain-containing protein n=1 Tax=Rhipicephalus sanguineus TaxID=34632 RepID=A0A9D4PY28_RHISA|nr:hypothetical protein HPB52_010116 [Rhipicephalus sanguineus]